jgi:precorrin-6A/cobalt-precorrin-6A reductase
VPVESVRAGLALAAAVQVGLGGRVGGRILVLGGTREGRELADALARAGLDPVTSLAGRTSRPRTPAGGTTRSGGFGGVEGLAAYVSDAVDAIVDASHPYAAAISANAAAAATRTGVPLLRVDRPGWGGHPDASQWRWVADHDEAAAAAATAGERPLLTVGRQRLARYAGPLADHAVLARIADLAPGAAGDAPQWSARWRLLVARGPFEQDGERELFAGHGVDVLVTKDSGGEDTAAKLTVARLLSVPVVVVRRPPPVPGVPVVTDVAAALSWCAQHR